MNFVLALFVAGQLFATSADTFKDEAACEAEITVQEKGIDKMFENGVAKFSPDGANLKREDVFIVCILDAEDDTPNAGDQK